MKPRSPARQAQVGLREAARVAPQLLAPWHARLDAILARVRWQRSPERVARAFIGEDK
jgi:hypothetical protein